MASLTVLKFSTPEGAEGMLSKLQALQNMHLIKIQDAAIVTWPEGRKKPKTQQLHNLAGRKAMEGAFWGMLLGMIFFVPVLAMAAGAAVGSLAGNIVRFWDRRPVHQADPRKGHRRYFRTVPDDKRCSAGSGGRGAQGFRIRADRFEPFQGAGAAAPSR